jgi:hypothetical protein
MYQQDGIFSCASAGIAGAGSIATSTPGSTIVTASTKSIFANYRSPNLSLVKPHCRVYIKSQQGGTLKTL